MISDSPTDLIEEAKDGTRYVLDHIAGLAKMIQKYHGPSFTTASSDYLAENTYFTFAGLYIPKLVFGTPQWRCTTPRTGQASLVATAGGHALNRIARQTRLKHQLELAALDMLFAFGAYETYLRKVPNALGSVPDADLSVRSLPVTRRVPQDRLLIDPCAIGRADCRFQGYRFEWDYAQLKDAARRNPELWNMDVVDALENSSPTSSSTDTLRDEVRPTRESRRTSTRKMVSGYLLHVPEIHLPDEQEYEHGTVFTLIEFSKPGVDGKQAAHLRPPRPFFGHETGPLSMFGVYDVPGEPLPLGPLTAMDRSINELAAVMEALQERAQNYRRQVLAGGTIIDALNDAGDEYMIEVDDVDFDSNKVAVVERGGASQHDLAWAQIQKGNVDRGLSVSDALEGEVTGRGTAMENSIAATAQETRSGRIVDRFTDGLIEVGEKSLYLMYHEDSVMVPLGEAGSRAIGMEEAWWYGGIGEGEPYLWHDLDLIIEPLTVGRMSRLERRELADKRLTVVSQMATIQAQLPFVRGIDELRRWGEAHDMFDVDEAFDEEKLAMFLQQLQGSQATFDTPPMFQSLVGGGSSVAKIGAPGGGGGNGRGMLTKGERAMEMMGSNSGGSIKPAQSASGGGLMGAT